MSVCRHVFGCVCRCVGVCGCVYVGVYVCVWVCVVVLLMHLRIHDPSRSNIRSEMVSIFF